MSMSLFYCFLEFNKGTRHKIEKQDNNEALMSRICPDEA